jgi:predicted DNA-binding protein
MIRTQIQLTEEQAQELKKLAAAQNRSIADLVRDGVDRVLESTGGSRRERMLRAASAFGRFRSGTTDLAARHDDDFAEAVATRRRR